MENQTLTLYPKIEWRIDMTLPIDSVFHPPLIKKIKHSEPYYDSLFNCSVSHLTKHVFLQSFLPMYDVQIARLANYHLDLNHITETVLRRIESPLPLHILSVEKKQSGEFCGGIIFTIRENRVTIFLRVFDKTIKKQFKKETTLDYWAEYQFRKYVKTLNKPLLKHGTDTHPYIERVGLPVFKLKVGAKPAIAKKYTTGPKEQISTILNLKKDVLLFYSPKKNGEMSEAMCAYTKTQNPNLLSECKTLLNEAHITATFIEV